MKRNISGLKGLWYDINLRIKIRIRMIFISCLQGNSLGFLSKKKLLAEPVNAPVLIRLVNNFPIKIVNLIWSCNFFVLKNFVQFWTAYLLFHQTSRFFLWFNCFCFSKFCPILKKLLKACLNCISWEGFLF